MSTRQSVRAAIAVLGVVIVGCASDKAPGPEKTFLTVSGTSDIAFAIGSTGHVIEAITSAGTNTNVTSNTNSSSSSGGGFFSASVATGGSFSSSGAGSGTYSASTGGSSSFSSSVAGSGTFSGSSVLGPSCSLNELCDFAVAFCQAFASSTEAAQCNQDVGQCYALVNSSDFQSQLSADLASANVPAGFLCALLDYLECIVHSGTSLTSFDESVALACAEQSGLLSLFQQELAATH